MNKRDKENYLIQSVSHALDVMDVLVEANGELGVTEIANKLGLHKNNIFRLLATLLLKGYVEQNPRTEDYKLGPKCIQLGQAYTLQASVVQRVTPLLRDLSSRSGETVSFAVLQSNQVMYPISVESKKPVKVAPRQAVALPAKFSAVGRLLTAQLADAELEEVLKSNTPQDAAIRSQMADLRSSGLIVDRGALEAEVVNISHVIKGVDDQTIGAVELLMPQYRSKVEEITVMVKEAAAQMSKIMGAAGFPTRSTSSLTNGSASGLATSVEKIREKAPKMNPTVSTAKSAVASNISARNPAAEGTRNLAAEGSSVKRKSAPRSSGL